jgi:hypothetical protein
MAATVGQAEGEGEVGSGDWAVSRNPAVRSLLDHVAEELAAEFVRLMKAAAVENADSATDEEKR